MAKTTAGPPPLTEFLISAKKALINAIANKKRVMLVIGRDTADIDSVASSILFAYLRTAIPPEGAWSRKYIPILNTKRAEIANNGTLLRALPHAGLEIEHLICLDDLIVQGSTRSGLTEENTRFFLINHNLLLVHHNLIFGRKDSTYSKNIAGCVDNHVDEQYVPEKTAPEPRIIGRAGSTASLIAYYGRKSWGILEARQKGEWAPQLAKLALAAVLLNTSNLEARELLSEEDVVAAWFLEAQVSTAEGGASFNRRAFYRDILGRKGKARGFGSGDHFPDRSSSIYTAGSPTDVTGFYRGSTEETNGLVPGGNINKLGSMNGSFKRDKTHEINERELTNSAPVGMDATIPGSGAALSRSVEDAETSRGNDALISEAPKDTAAELPSREKEAPARGRDEQHPDMEALEKQRSVPKDVAMDNSEPQSKPPNLEPRPAQQIPLFKTNPAPDNSGAATKPAENGKSVTTSTASAQSYQGWRTNMQPTVKENEAPRDVATRGVKPTSPPLNFNPPSTQTKRFAQSQAEFEPTNTSAVIERTPQESSKSKDIEVVPMPYAENLQPNEVKSAGKAMNSTRLESTQNHGLGSKPSLLQPVNTTVTSYPSAYGQRHYSDSAESPIDPLAALAREPWFKDITSGDVVVQPPIITNSYTNQTSHSRQPSGQAFTNVDSFSSSYKSAEPVDVQQVKDKPVPEQSVQVPQATDPIPSSYASGGPPSMQTIEKESASEPPRTAPQARELFPGPYNPTVVSTAKSVEDKPASELPMQASKALGSRPWPFNSAVSALAQSHRTQTVLDMPTPDIQHTREIFQSRDTEDESPADINKPVGNKDTSSQLSAVNGTRTRSITKSPESPETALPSIKGRNEKPVEESQRAPPQDFVGVVRAGEMNRQAGQFHTVDPLRTMKQKEPVQQQRPLQQQNSQEQQKPVEQEKPVEPETSTKTKAPNDTKQTAPAQPLVRSVSIQQTRGREQTRIIEDSTPVAQGPSSAPMKPTQLKIRTQPLLNEQKVPMDQKALLERPSNQKRPMSPSLPAEHSRSNTLQTSSRTNTLQSTRTNTLQSTTAAGPAVFDILAQDFEQIAASNQTIGISSTHLSLTQLILLADRNHIPDSTTPTPQSLRVNTSPFTSAIRKFASARNLSVYCLSTSYESTSPDALGPRRELFLWVMNFGFLIPIFTLARGMEFGLERWGVEGAEEGSAEEQWWAVKDGISRAFWQRNLEVGRERLGAALVECLAIV